jgi:hypothetical protein
MLAGGQVVELAVQHQVAARTGTPNWRCRPLQRRSRRGSGAANGLAVGSLAVIGAWKGARSPGHSRGRSVVSVSVAVVGAGDGSSASPRRDSRPARTAILAGQAVGVRGMASGIVDIAEDQDVVDAERREGIGVGQGQGPRRQAVVAVGWTLSSRLPLIVALGRAVQVALASVPRTVEPVAARQQGAIGAQVGRFACRRGAKLAVGRRWRGPVLTRSITGRRSGSSRRRTGLRRCCRSGRRAGARIADDVALGSYSGVERSYSASIDQRWRRS